TQDAVPGPSPSFPTFPPFQPFQPFQPYPPFQPLPPSPTLPFPPHHSFSEGGRTLAHHNHQHTRSLAPASDVTLRSPLHPTAATGGCQRSTLARTPGLCSPHHARHFRTLTAPLPTGHPRSRLDRR